MTDREEKNKELQLKRPKGDTHSPTIKPDPYVGKRQWEPYLKHFEMFATRNCWDDKDKCEYQAVLLTGSAQLTLDSLQAEGKDYGQLIKTLECSLDPSGGKDLNRAKLRSRRQQKPSESLDESAEETRRLVQVYPDMPEKTRGRLGHDQ